MITDNQTNTIFVSELLKTDNRFSNFYKRFEDLLLSQDLKLKTLPNTNDIWARDYMPIQISEKKFIEYRYDPDYLQGKQKTLRGLKTCPDLVSDELGFKTIKSDLILDGGNIIKYTDKVILTNKIFNENKHNYKYQVDVINELKRMFEVETVIIIPWDIKNDKYGHSDGMIRFLDEKNVLMHEYYPGYIHDKVYATIKKHDLKIKKISFNVKKPNYKLNWAYINFLQTKDILIIPKLGIDEDQQALEQIEGFFPDYKKRMAIFQISVKEFFKYGGALNCITWTIKE